MRKEGEIFLTLEENEDHWGLLQDVCEHWNESMEPKMENIFDTLIKIHFHDINVESYKALIQLFEEYKQSIGIVYYKTFKVHYNEEEYDNASYIHLIGDSFDEIFIDINDIQLQKVPCNSCEMYKTIPPENGVIIDGKIWQEKNKEQNFASPDVINIPRGGLLISEKFSEVLQQTGATGYTLIPAIENSSNLNTPKFYQLVATEFMPLPDLKSIPLAKEKICVECGSVNQTLSSDFIWPFESNDFDFISRDSSKIDLIYMSRKIYKNLKSSDIKGIYLGDIIKVNKD